MTDSVEEAESIFKQYGHNTYEWRRGQHFMQQMNEAVVGRVKLSSIKYYCLHCSDPELYERKIDNAARNAGTVMKTIKGL
jgi:hypothetical protein